MLTPVENPTAYGLVETDPDGNILRFLEKPKAEEITCDTINAGIYVLEPETFDRIPEGVAWSIERSFFPVVHRTPRDLPRVDLSRLLDRHRHAGKVHAGAPRHHGRALFDAAVQRPARQGMGRAERDDRRSAHSSTARSSSMRDATSKPEPASDLTPCSGETAGLTRTRASPARLSGPTRTSVAKLE